MKVQKKEVYISPLIMSFLKVYLDTHKLFRFWTKSNDKDLAFNGLNVLENNNIIINKYKGKNKE